MPCLLEDELQRLYELYPRKVGKTAALKAIRKAVVRLKKENPELENENSRIAWLKEKIARFANSQMGNAGTYTPYPATWFNQGRYLDDPKEWGTVQKNGRCSLHRNAGLTQWGSCWECYSEKYGSGASA